MSESSTPPGYSHLRIPHSVIWGWIGSCIGGLIALLLTWQAMHDDVLTLKLQIGALKEAADRGYGLAASCESRLDVAERKIERLERDR